MMQTDLFLPVKHSFPSYDLVKDNLFNKLAKRRYEMLRWVYNDSMTIKILIFVVR